MVLRPAGFSSSAAPVSPPAGNLRFPPDSSCPANRVRPAFYRSRRPRETALYRVLEGHYAGFREVYEDRYAARYGHFRPVMEKSVEEYLKCGIADHGFARVRCGKCGHEMFVAFSCKRRCFCPSCHAKRVILLGLRLSEEICAPVPHRQFVFTIPKRLRLYFLYNRSLLNDLARCAAGTVREVYAAVMGEGVPGQVVAIQTFGDLLNFHPHIHALVTDGVFMPSGVFRCLPDIPDTPFVKLFSHRVFRLLLDRGPIDGKVIAFMRRWKHSGFSVNRDTRIAAGDTEGIRRVGEYIARNPFSERRVVRVTEGGVVYRASHAQPQAYLFAAEGRETARQNYRIFSPYDFLAAVLQHIPDTNQQMVMYYGSYSNRSRGERRKRQEEQGIVAVVPAEQEKQKVNRSWAMLIKRVYEVDPLECPRCGTEMKVVGFITQRTVITRILDHVRRRKGRAPP